MYIFREAWRAYCWRNQAARLQFWFLEELLRRSTATRGRWGGVGLLLVRSGCQVRLILKKKKGFVKLALKCGVSLVPTFSFGEASIYDKVTKGKRQIIITMAVLLA